MINKYLFIYLAVAAMLVILAIQVILSMAQTSPVCDEVSHHIATGYSFLKTRDFRLNSTSPPLTEELCALPLLFLRPRLPLDHPSWDKIDRVTFGSQFLYRYNNNADKLVFWSRIPMVLLSVLCGLLVFTYAGELYGRGVGLFALFLYIFSPNILAYSGLAIPDMGASFFILLALYRFYKFLRKPNGKNMMFAGISLGLAEASKFSALILLPLFLAMSIWKALVSKRWRYLISTLAIMSICYVVVFISYFGEIKPLLKNDIDVEEKIAYIEKASDKIFGYGSPLKEKVIEFALNTPIPFSTYIMNILAETNMVFVKDYGAFLLGKKSLSGWWYYYPVVFILKTTIPVIILLFFLILYFRRARPRDVWGERSLFLFLAGFAIAGLFTKLQLSVRYILPIYPIIFIMVSKMAAVKKNFLVSLIIVLLCLWHVSESFKIHPNYLSYFNQFAKGPDNGWRYLRDANIDYGQDLPALAKYVKNKGLETVRLLYWGSADPGYYGIVYEKVEDIERDRPDEAIYAISANYMDSVQWVKDIKPTAKAGYSIFIYDMRKSKETQ